MASVRSVKPDTGSVTGIICDPGFERELRRSYNKKGSRIRLCVGIAIGTAVGAATHNIGLWMPVGLAAGTSLGLVFGAAGKMITMTAQTISGRHTDPLPAGAAGHPMRIPLVKSGAGYAMIRKKKKPAGRQTG